MGFSFKIALKLRCSEEDMEAYDLLLAMLKANVTYDSRREQLIVEIGEPRTLNLIGMDGDPLVGGF